VAVLHEGQLQQVDVDLNSLVQQTSDAFRSLMTERQHQFTVSLSGKHLWVHGDPRRLEQVLVNLLSNAAKYTPEGGRVWLTVEGAETEAVVRLEDNGVGINAALLPHVFDLFSQGKRTLDRAQGGLGLGLSLVKRLVEMHGGTVTAASEGQGKGSRFTVRLPLLPGNRPLVRLVLVIAAARGLRFFPRQGLRRVCAMLLVEIPWASRVWALPFLSVLAPSERYAQERGKRHKKITEWAWQLLLQVRRWYPEREIVAVADST
jgi:two-component sensor histidine kinase